MDERFGSCAVKFSQLQIGNASLRSEARPVWAALRSMIPEAMIAFAGFSENLLGSMPPKWAQDFVDGIDVRWFLTCGILVPPDDGARHRVVRG